MFFLVLISLLSVLTFLIYKSKTSNYWKKRNVVQIDGTFMEFVFGNKPLAEVYKKVYDSYPNENYVGIFTGGQPTLFVKDLENVQAILAGDFLSFHSRGVPYNPKDTLSNNVLFTSDYKRWRILRQKMSPIFSNLKLKNMFYIMDRCAQDFVKRIDENPKAMARPYDTLITYTTASVTAAAFGIDAQIKNTLDSPLIDTAKESVKLTLTARIINGIASYIPNFMEMINYKPLGSYENIFVNALRNVIENRKKENVKRYDFVDTCLELQQAGLMKDATTGYELEPTVEVLAAQAFFFFLAGTDTSANTMNATLLEISKNPKILERVHKEIDEIFDGCDNKLTFNEMEKMQYLDMVLNEATRKYPPIGLLTRLCTKDTIMPVGGVKVEKGNLVVVPTLGIHRDERYYPNPNLFDPERFSQENVSKIPRYAFLSFGEGNRVCLGERFARLQVKAGLAWLLRKYTLKPSQTVEPTFEVSFFALKDVNMHYQILPRCR